MSEKKSGTSVKKHAGIRLNHLNILLSTVGLIIAALMVFFTYQTTESVTDIVSVTDTYLDNQQAGGMLRDVAASMAEQAMAFVRDGQPGPASAYDEQRNAVLTRMKLYMAGSAGGKAADEAYQQAVDTFNMQYAVDLRAMRLVADTLPVSLFSALPAFLQEAELSAEDLGLSPEEKKAAALALLTSDEYAGYAGIIRSAVDSSHRLSSEGAKKQAAETSSRVADIVRTQTALILLFVALSVSALVINHALLISPIGKSVGNLDRREPIPERGCYEMQHLASVYNDVLADNQEKTEKLSYTATHDALTGLINRADFDRLFETAALEQIGIVVADVDHFKQYNDDFGHDIGDKVLRAASNALKHNFRAEDQVCRIGGDEFCVIMPGLCHADGNQIVERIVRINRELEDVGEDLPPITLSAGVAFWNRPNPKGTIFKDADSALIDLKKTRNGCCAVYRG